MATYLSPALLYMYGKWLISPDFVNKLFFRGSLLGLTLITTFILRSYGRAINPKYKAFHQDLINAKLDYTSENKVSMKNYIKLFYFIYKIMNIFTTNILIHFLVILNSIY